MVKILDCTTRDGGHAQNWDFESDFVKKYISVLEKTNIDFYEIGYRNYYEKEGKGKFFNCDKEFLKSLFPERKNIQIGIMTDTSRFNINDFEENAQNDCIDFIRIATHPERIKETLTIAEELHQRGYNIFVQLMEVPNLKKEHYTILKKWRNKKILKSLYIADTYSKVKPEEIENYFTELKNIGYENISFHAHNKHGLAFENTIKAIELGAYSVDVSLFGIGTNLNNIDLLNKIGISTKEYNSFS